MVVENFRRRFQPTSQYYFRPLLRLRIEHTREWAFMDKVPYEVLDHAMREAIAARDEVITRNRELFSQRQIPRHKLHFVSRKEDRQTIAIRAQYCREPLRFYLRLLHCKQQLAMDPENPRYKDLSTHPPTHPPLHHEKRRRNNGWPNVEGKVEMDSKLIYERQVQFYVLFHSSRVVKLTPFF
jgi:hypothetical protein